MIDRSKVLEVLEGYDLEDLRIGMIASHSALDTADGAVEENFRTLAVCQEGREKPYVKYFRANRDKSGKIMNGMIDEVMMLKKFPQILEQENQDILKEKNTLFVPNRSFTSYCGIDAVEDQFLVPLFGSRNLLRSEERGDKRDYYWILEKAGLPYPEPIEAEDINQLVMVKLPHAVKTLERGFFTAASYEEYCQKADLLLRQNVIDQDGIELARIERYIIGPVFNLDFFYSPISKQIELIGIDWRFETTLDGHCRLPAPAAAHPQREADQSGVHRLRPQLCHSARVAFGEGLRAGRKVRRSDAGVLCPRHHRALLSADLRGQGPQLLHLRRRSAHRRRHQCAHGRRASLRKCPLAHQHVHGPQAGARGAHSSGERLPGKDRDLMQEYD